ncbi:LysR family transcriptional regulator [Roseomonas sp. KE2513]|uniref:LysR family transcriptional regulator n=1 Tax=Roseomonas sp. KE2513 TaxID=2479202 RepID=UPI0018DF9155|nr:LysR family transcriptional regulator [Roseomonas sp. KE2513]MBI0539657.1 LysR family transcriptional regulator [Roseomonas sp. KE2513]
MDLRELRGFVEVARLRSVSAAAKALHIAQPALTRQIRKLEQELGTVLFVRSARGVEPTAAGALLLRRAERLLRDVGQLREEVTGAEHAVSGRVAIAMPPTTGALVMPRLLARMRRDHPGVSIHVMEGVNATLLEWVMGGRADLALMHDPPSLTLLRSEVLLREALHLVSPPGALPQGCGQRPEVRVRDLHGLPLILPARPHLTRLLVEQAAAAAGVRLDIVVEADGVALTRNLVAAGFGHGVLAPATVRAQVAAGEVVAAPLRGRALHTVLCLVDLASAPGDAARRAAEAVVREEVLALQAAGAWGGLMPDNEN